MCVCVCAPPCQEHSSDRWLPTLALALWSGASPQDVAKLAGEEFTTDILFRMRALPFVFFLLVCVAKEGALEVRARAAIPDGQFHANVPARDIAFSPSATMTATRMQHGSGADVVQGFSRQPACWTFQGAHSE